MQTQQKFTIGDPVNYYALPLAGQPTETKLRYAVITDIHNDEEVALTVFEPGGLRFEQRVKRAQNDQPMAGRWAGRLPK